MAKHGIKRIHRVNSKPDNLDGALDIKRVETVFTQTLEIIIPLHCPGLLYQLRDTVKVIAPKKKISPFGVHGHLTTPAAWGCNADTSPRTDPHLLLKGDCD